MVPLRSPGAHALVPTLQSGSGNMSRALHFARAALECSGDLGLALSLSLIALQYLWVQTRVER